MSCGTVARGRMVRGRRRAQHNINRSRGEGAMTRRSGAKQGIGGHRAWPGRTGEGWSFMGRAGWVAMGMDMREIHADALGAVYTSW